MEKPYEYKITWTIKDFSSFQSNTICSHYFVVGGCKWRIKAYPKGYNDDNHLSLYLNVADSEVLPCGWKRNIKFRLRIANQHGEEFSEMKEISSSKWVDHETSSWGFPEMIPFAKLQEKDGGFLVKDEVKIVAELDVLEFIEKSDVLVEETTQVKYVNGLLERHQDVATNVKNQYEKKITWTIKNFSSLQFERFYSDHFVVNGCKWRLKVYPKGDGDDSHLSLYLEVSDSEFLNSEWRRCANFRLTVVNQLREELSKVLESPAPFCFDQNVPILGSPVMLPLTKLQEKDGGFLVNDEVKIIAELDVLEVIEKSNFLEEEITPVNVNGFQVLPSQVKFVNSLFEKHPNIATKLHVKNQYLKTGYMNVLLSLIDILRQFPEKISGEDLDDAYATLQSLTDIGFELDWLKKKFDHVLEKKEKEEAGEIRMRGIEEALKDLKHDCADLEALMEKQKAELLAARAPLSLFDDF